MKIEAEIREVYVVVESSRHTFMGCYEPSEDYCEIHYAQTLGELFTLIAKHIIYPAKGFSFSVYKLKALIYNGEVYSRAVSGEYVRDSDFMDDYKGNFLSSSKIERKEYEEFVKWAKSSEQYRTILKEKRMRDKAEKLQKKKEAEEKDSLRKKKEYETYLELRKKYELNKGIET